MLADIHFGSKLVNSFIKMNVMGFIGLNNQKSFCSMCL